ncbi:MAG: VTT domain-containing protein [Candidatus Pacearchaeota archaeon]|jgi:uncharacterized membrane protein YdjX (TVP38/TMEM64 family)
MEKDSEQKRSISKAKLYLLILLLIGLIGGYVYLHSIGINASILERFGKNQYAPIVYIALFVTTSFIPVIYAPLTFLGAATFPFHLAFIYAFIGNILLSTVMFYLTRWLGRDYFSRWEKKNKKVEELDIKFKENAFRDVFLLRLFFIIPGEVINIVAGISKVRYRDFIFASAIGFSPVLLASIFLVKSKIEANLMFFILSVTVAAIILIIPLIYLSSLRLFIVEKYNQIKGMFSKNANVSPVFLYIDKFVYTVTGKPASEKTKE